MQQQVIVLASHLPASFDPASGRVILDAAELRLPCPSVGEAEFDEHLGAISDDLLLHSPSDPLRVGQGVVVTLLATLAGCCCVSEPPGPGPGPGVAPVPSPAPIVGIPANPDASAEPDAAPARPSSAPPHAPLPNQSRLVSFAASPDGTLLATGSDWPADDTGPVTEGVVLWDTRAGVVVRQIPLEYGVGIADCLARGVQFSPDGRLIGFNFQTNSVGVAEVATGKILLDTQTNINDVPPSWTFSADSTQVFVGDASDYCEERSIGALFPARGPREAGVCVRAGPDRWTRSALLVANGRVHVGSGSELLSVDPSGRTPVRAVVLPGAPRTGLTPSASGRFAAGGHPVGTVGVLFDVPGQRALWQGPLTGVTGFAFAGDETLWAAVRAETRSVTGVDLFRAGAPLGSIPGPLEPRELYLADGLPFVWSAKGDAVVVMRPGGVLERWSVRPLQRVSALPTVAGANGLVWAAPDRLIAIGPDVLAFIALDSGTIISEYRRSDAKR